MIKFANPDITDADVDAVTRCLRSGWLTTGHVTAKFEELFASRVGARNAIAVSSATSAALLLLQALEARPGSEIIFPAYTFSGPAMMAHHLGLRVVLADCIPGTRQIDPNDVLRKITRETVAVVPTHMAGEACDLRWLREVCNGFGSKKIRLIDDAAHAFPTRYPDGSPVGSDEARADATFFSFYATKNLTTCEGGMITTSNDQLATALRSLRSHGFSRDVHDRYTNPSTGWEYDIAVAGWKANMPDIAAALGTSQLHRAELSRIKRAKIAQAYTVEFSSVLRKPSLQHTDWHSWHLYQIEVEDRDLFIRKMAARGVQCSVHFKPLHLMSFWQQHLAAPPLPHAERAYKHSVSLPISSAMTRADVDTVIEAVKGSL